MLQIKPHPELHTLFEALGYVLGFGAFKMAARASGDVLDSQQRWNVIAAAFVGALIGSRALDLLAEAPRAHFTWLQMVSPGGGKTVVGGLLGGWLAVEIVKKVSGVQTRTGDLFAIPLCIGIGVGRVGCLLAGMTDQTYGKPTSLPWGVDFGDGVARHPTQAYEIVFLAVLALALHYLPSSPSQSSARPEGTLFRWFMAAYLSWRLLIDFLKPEPTMGGLNAIQWASIAGLVLLAATWKRSASDMSSTRTRDYA